MSGTSDRRCACQALLRVGMPAAAGLIFAGLFQPSLGQDSQQQQGGTSWQELVRVKNAAAVVYIEGTVTEKGADVEHPLISPTGGSGFIISSEGYVITCSHVVPVSSENKSVEIFGRVGGPNETKYRLEEIDRLTQHDLVLLRFAERLEPWPSVQTMDRPKIGAPILALGYYNSSFFVVPGSITNTFAKAGHWITDAQLNEGMSGGPVFDNTLGVAAIVARGDRSANGVTELIPISFAKPLLDEAASSMATASSRAVQDTAKTIANARDQLEKAKAAVNEGQFSGHQNDAFNAAVAQQAVLVDQWALRYGDYVKLNRSNPAPKSNRERQRIVTDLKHTAMEANKVGAVINATWY